MSNPLQINGRTAIKVSTNMRVGYQALWRDGNVIWAGPLGAPTEDVDYDAVTLHPDDYYKLLMKLRAASSTG